MPTFFFFQVKNCLSLTLKVVFSSFSFWILFFLLIFQFKSSLKLILVRCQQNICLDQKWKKNNLKRTTNQHPTNQLHVNLKGSSASCSLRSGMLALDTVFFFFLTVPFYGEHWGARLFLIGKHFVLGVYKVLSMNKSKRGTFLLRVHLIFYHLIYTLKKYTVLKTT